MSSPNNQVHQPLQTPCACPPAPYSYFQPFILTALLLAVSIDNFLILSGCSISVAHCLPDEP